MKTSSLLIAAIILLLATAIFITPGYTRGWFEPASSAPNSPPVATDDNYIKHGGGTIGPLLANDFDPDGDAMTVQIMTFPTRGSLFGLNGNSFNYQLSALSYVGTDSFTYRACAVSLVSFELWSFGALGFALWLLGTQLYTSLPPQTSSKAEARDFARECGYAVSTS